MLGLCGAALAGPTGGTSGAGGAAPAEQGRTNMAAVVWTVDNLVKIGGHAVKVIGEPRVTETDRGRVLVFDGTKDALLLEANPLEGLCAFTVEAMFRPDAGGAVEQRFVHFQETGAENRVLLETRVPSADVWFGDTFIRTGPHSSALNDAKLTHPLGAWHTLALVCDGKTMVQYVDGVRELASRIPYEPMKAGAVSLGVRINRASWFKGAIHTVRISPRALAPAELLRP
jgi:hypothetical protein